ncbi:DNA polymerase III subunit gamma/tau [Aerococcus sp. HMSC035B07]|uniref:DNA polymerase III subunit gamma/tau n=1 Tax=Aerococcus sp. HMSC035B07 TaxID=1715184 RepID=UPI0008A9609D|nr:DNA polymerase III subunit gamma/tau [Aerococcus sp. HMSC035B07]OHO44980.1 DNA polymerase III subunit gamma/tau [Aerococcus sp. HMSC035B07]
MSYQALYRVWRPQRFADIVGQMAVSRTLRNAIREGKTSHAYLFTGPRGTGKTSAAKIFAKAINCPNQTDGEPCNECAICQAITEGTLADVIEIDAASNNGVEEIRDIRDKVRYTPTEAQYKVYIIDEVHMLSTGAFNALLKTLEEPPAHVVFILATTEPHKIPATIISRTQRFDFRRIRNTDIEERLAYILKSNDQDYEEDSLKIIARAANGGMRDALSLLDQSLSFAEGSLDAETARLVTGTLSEDQMLAYSRALLKQDARQALDTLHQILNQGQEANRFVEEMLAFIRDLLMAKELGGQESELTRHFSQAFFDLAKDFPDQALYLMMDHFQEAQSELRFTSQPEIYLEVLSIRLSQSLNQAPAPSEAPGSSPVSQEAKDQLEALTAQVKSLQDQIAQGTAAVPAKGQGKASPKRQAAGSVNYKPNYGLIYKTLSEATNTDRHKIESVWPDLVESLPNIQQALLKQTYPAAASPEYFVLRFDYAILCQKVADDQAIKDTVAKRLQEGVGHPGKMLILTSEQWNEARQNYVTAHKAGKLDELLGDQAPTETQQDAPSEEKPADSDQTLLEGVQAKEDNPLAEEAIKLFGADNVTVVDD